MATMEHDTTRRAVEAHPELDARELRLALVCYGGVSLAIYMHGITKEIHKLVLASAAFNNKSPTTDPAKNPFPASDTESVYWDVLRRMYTGELGRRPRGVRTRVMVDIIAGTSAGGINGICLAKALAHNRSQDALKTMWLERGDIKRLLGGWQWVPLWFKGLKFATKALARPKHIKPPLLGDEIGRWIYEAFSEMDRTDSTLPGVPSLIPSGESLELFVPITDFHGYDRRIPLEDPPFIADRTHRHVLQFRRDDNRSDFGKEFNHWLAFAARATSSFPGAFPPVSLPDFGKYFSPKVTLQPGRLFPLYPLAPAEPDKTYFVDGGVLDNYPFGKAIEAIRWKPAGLEVDRRLLYIEPDPRADAAPFPVGKAPSWHGTIWGTFASIPRREPILDDLMHLAQRNEIVARIRDVIETSWAEVATEVEARLGEHRPSDKAWQLPHTPPPEHLAQWRDKIESHAEKTTGMSYATYIRLRIRLAIEKYGRVIGDVLEFPSTSYQSAFVVNVLRGLAQEPTEDGKDDALLKKLTRPSDRQKEFLQTFDLDYHERRIRFVIAAVSWWYRDIGQPGYPTRSKLDAAKVLLYGHLAELQGIIVDLAKDAEVARELGALFKNATIATAGAPSPRDFARAHRTELRAVARRVGATIVERLSRLESRLYENMATLSQDWPDAVTRDLVLRYVGFAVWDVLLYPLQTVQDVGERDHVEVMRISPLDVSLLGDPANVELAGMKLFHFGAFFSRKGRENDYLLGRLHAAERLLTLLLDHLDKPTGEAEEARTTRTAREQALLRGACKTAFTAILASERGSLTQVPELFRELDAKIATL